MKTAFRLSVLSLVIAALTACTQERYHFNEGAIFGTVYHLTYKTDKDLQQAIETELNRFDTELSMFNPNSTLSRINKHDTTPFDLNPHPMVLHVIQKSLEFSALTNGAFDITVAPLVNAWGFGYTEAATVTQPYLDSLMAFVGYQRLSLEHGFLTKSDARIKLDASAIAKGYACDVVAEVLEKNGVSDYLVEIGGEMVLKGKNPNGDPWRIGINSPEDDSTSTHLTWSETLSLTNCGLATSGNYRRFYFKDGKRYVHTLNPANGYPVQSNLLSATVIAGDCLTADALATAFMVMGAEEAGKLVDKLPGVEALFICVGENDETSIIKTAGISSFQH